MGRIRYIRQDRKVRSDSGQRQGGGGGQSGGATGSSDKQRAAGARRGHGLGHRVPSLKGSRRSLGTTAASGTADLRIVPWRCLARYGLGSRGSTDGLSL